MGRLGGTCGIPAYDDRIYLCVESVTASDGRFRPTRIRWDRGHVYPVVVATLAGTYGRRERGNLVFCWDVELPRKAHRELWWETGRWFVKRCGGSYDETGA